MTSLKILSTAAALALALPVATPSFAQSRGGHAAGGSIGGARMGGGNFAASAPMRPTAGTTPSFSGAARPMSSTSPSFSGGTRSFSTASSGTWNGGNWNGGNWNGGNWHGGWHHHHHGGFWPGFAAGAAIGGLGSYAYYGGPYYGDSYYDDGYYDDGPTVAVVPDAGGDSSAYCAQRYRSYDPASGTYLGYDGLRHPCP